MTLASAGQASETGRYLYPLSNLFENTTNDPCGSQTDVASASRCLGLATMVLIWELLALLHSTEPFRSLIKKPAYFPTFIQSSLSKRSLLSRPLRIYPESLPDNPMPKRRVNQPTQRILQFHPNPSQNHPS